MNIYFKFFLLNIAIAMSFSSYAIDNIQIDEKNGLFIGIDKTIPVLTANYVGWGRNWRWANSNIVVDHLAHKNNLYSHSLFKGHISDLEIDFDGTINIDSKTKQFIWTYHWNKNLTVDDAIGFGIDFQVKLDSPSFEQPISNPELLADNKGWQWQTANHKITVEFNPPLAQSVIEKNNIRNLFFTAINKGEQQSVMKVTVSPTVKLSPPISFNYDPIQLSQWQPDILPAENSPIDLSFLNQNHIPAGRHGFIKTKGDQLVFSDGTPAKFWGTNLQAYALFSTSDEKIKLHAKRLAQLGFNLVRIHHHDSNWVMPNIFEHPEKNTQILSETSFKKLDWWIKCLTEQGIYVWLDLHVGRSFTANDEIENFEEFAKGKKQAEIKGFNYYNHSIETQLQQFNEYYLSHVNSFTHLAYQNDPAIIAVLISNENDLSQHFGNLFVIEKKFPVHNQLFMKDVHAFSELYELNADKVWRSWEMGESKIYLNDVEHRFNQKMMMNLKALGLKSLIAPTSSWGGMGLFSLPSLTDGGIIDVHSYGKAEEFSKNPRFNANFLSWISAANVAGKPLSITEWNIDSFPANDRFTAPLFMASIANLQGWDAPMLYGYSQSSLNEKTKGSNYSTFNDPAIIGLMPAAALLYRQQHVSAAKYRYQIALDRQNFFFTRYDPANSKTLRTLTEISQVSIRMPNTPQLPWLKNSLPVDKNTILINDMNKDFTPPNQSIIVSDTGELQRDWEKSRQIINTPRSQIVSGQLAGDHIQLSNASFDINTKKAVIAIQSVDEKAIEDSHQIFITSMARSQPDPEHKLIFLSEPVIGKISFNAPKGLKLYPVLASGNLATAIETNYQKGRYYIELNLSSSHWFILKK